MKKLHKIGIGVYKYTKLALILALIGTTTFFALSYFSTQTTINRWETTIYELGREYDVQQCALGRYKQDKGIDASMELSYCDERTTEDVMEWGAEFAEKFGA